MAELEAKEELYLFSRKLVPRIKQPISGIISVLIVIFVALGLWQVFFTPGGTFSWLTPLFGYMIIAWLLVVAIWQAWLFNFWPFRQRLYTWSPAVRGVILVATNLVLVYIFIFIFFYNVIGRFAIPYFSTSALEALGIAGYSAQEYSSQAILFIASIATWFAASWPILFENWPWSGKLKQPVLGFTVWIFTFLVTFMLFLVLLHPHMSILFYPWQKYAGVAPPWWYDILSTGSRTVHGNFNIGWVMWCVAVLWMSATIWERKPWSTFPVKQPWKGFIAFIGVFFIAAMLFSMFVGLQSMWYGEAYEGGKRIFWPGWRFLHSGEWAIWILLPALILAFYFNNWPHRFSSGVNWIIRTTIAFGAGALAFNLYYYFLPWLIGVKGIAMPQDYPMAFAIWVIVLMVYHNWFMDNWPLWKRAPTAKS